MLLSTEYKTIRGLPLSAVSLSPCITCKDVTETRVTSISSLLSSLFFAITV